MQEQEQNRTEQATPFKLSEAKKKGQVAKSLDFNTFVIISGLLLGLMIWGRSQWQGFCELSAQLFAASGTLQLNTDSFAGTARVVATDALSILLPFAGVGFVFAVLANLIQTGPIFSGDPIKPKFERLNPVAGFKRIFNKRMMFEAVKSVIKLGFFGAIAFGFFMSIWPSLSQVAMSEPGGQMQWLADNAIGLLFRLGLALALVGLLDLAFARWQYKQQMMMSTREVKEEIKRREGDPLIRAKIRELQRENRKQARSLGRVPEADVLITNPEHLAIALKYDRARMNAPVVIAKGVDEWAAQMRAMAARHSIPRYERRRLARFLFRRVNIDEPIPTDCFVEVARIYAEVNELRRDRARYEVVA
ncbi:MAG TPA: EscU/YscU/HrcU family type III secretion system export apparatus switch protein [Steroidobacteraceae bacterium]|nr:EscU/YscU/HrcU family type III secretion system export apparatus switch protein [Steroidobacteraceae bacterium]